VAHHTATRTANTERAPLTALEENDDHESDREKNMNDEKYRRRGTPF
jgi:hypothetical protein